MSLPLGWPAFLVLVRIYQPSENMGSAVTGRNISQGSALTINENPMDEERMRVGPGEGDSKFVFDDVEVESMIAEQGRDGDI